MSAILVRLFKKGDKHVCDNYCGVSLLAVAGKVFARIILNRIQSVLEPKLVEERAGFRSNRSTADQIFTIKMLMEKSREYHQPLQYYICYMPLILSSCAKSQNTSKDSYECSRKSHKSLG